MNLKYKICGIKTIEEIEYINQINCEYVGFVFSKSKRQIDEACYKRITKYLRKGIYKVGVFKNEPIEYIKQIIQNTDIDIVQLHGNEEIKYIEEINKSVEVWKSVIGNEVLKESIEYYKNSVSRILVDAKNAGKGKCFKWDCLARIDTSELIIAGGISSDNIISFLEKYNVFAFDLSSSVENEKGKDLKLLLKFDEVIREVNSKNE